MPDCGVDFWSDRFHLCSIAAGFIAASQGRLKDSEYVRELAYGLYEGGAFKLESEDQLEVH